MTAPNRNTLWGRAIVDELAKAGVTAACVSPGSRSTPLAVAFAEHDSIEVFSQLDERSGAYFALGRAKRSGAPTPIVSTSGTAATNFHPAIVEADRARVPMIALTADRPPELRDSGANQTIDQEKLYGDAVRWYRDLPEPEADARKLRSLRTTVARAVATSAGTPPGPVHLNVPFRKPLEPVEVPGDVPDDFAERHPLAARGRDGPFVAPHCGTPTLDSVEREAVLDAIRDADRGLIVAGPTDDPDRAVADLAEATGFPLLADPLSGLRFGPHVDDAPVVGGYDSFLDDRAIGDWSDPDLVLRFGASPTSKRLRNYLARAGRGFVIDPGGGWREATFAASDLVVAAPGRFARAVTDDVDQRPVDPGWSDRFARAEARYWDAIDAALEDALELEGAVVRAAFEGAPDPATVFVSNSMPVRDADRFARPRAADLTALGNRGASGIDGITSAALGAGSAAAEPLVLVTGDLAYYHDMNGLLAIERCGVGATVVLINNDGGGIFHMLPIEDFDPPFTEGFKTPHGLDFSPSADLYGFEYERTDPGGFAGAYRDALESEGTRVVEVVVDAEASHRERERIHDRVCAELGEK